MEPNIGRTKILTIHGWAFCEEVFKNLPREYPIHHYRLEYLPSLKEEALNLLPLIDENTILVGWSAGASVALLAAYLSNKKPKGLLLIGATPHFGRAWKKSYIERFFKDLETNFEGKIKEFRTTVWGEPICQNLTLEKEKTINFLRSFVETDLSKVVEELKVPTILLQGKKDIIVPPKEAKKLKNLNPNFEIFYYDGGHFPKEFKPSDWEKFLQKLEEKKS
ncbi:MAG: alpha/beta hydrolase [Aquificota bacterium]